MYKSSGCAFAFHQASNGRPDWVSSVAPAQTHDRDAACGQHPQHEEASPHRGKRGAAPPATARPGSRSSPRITAVVRLVSETPTSATGNSRRQALSYVDDQLHQRQNQSIARLAPAAPGTAGCGGLAPARASNPRLAATRRRRRTSAAVPCGVWDAEARQQMLRHRRTSPASSAPKRTAGRRSPPAAPATSAESAGPQRVAPRPLAAEDEPDTRPPGTPPPADRWRGTRRRRLARATAASGRSR